MRELVALRRGWALQSKGLHARIGPRLIALCGIHDSDNERSVRQKVHRRLSELATQLPGELRRAVELAFALDPAHRYRRLSERVERLAMELSCQPRTARRRMDHGTALLAQTALQQAPTTVPSTDPERGWHVRSLKALLRLDTPTPELYETRTIVALRDHMDRIAIRFSLPRPPAHDSPSHDLIAEVLYGARIEDVERVSDAQHFRFLLALPRPLSTGAEHDYSMLLRLPDKQPMQPHYAFLPLVPCDSFLVRVRFAPDRQPRTIWRLSGVPPRLLDDDRPGDDRLIPDDAGEVELRFSGLEQGRGYGLAWTPLDDRR